MNNKIQIREIKATDSLRVAELSAELGYSADNSIVEEQIKMILSDSTHSAYVAILENKVVGYIHGFLSIRLTSFPFLEIGGLIVGEEHRNRGVGAKLVKHIEQKATGFYRVRVRCNVKRKSAHKFYLNLNYKEEKEQKIFGRDLNTN